MVLGSDVPLEKDILRRPKEFQLTWIEWSAQNRLQITTDLLVTAGTNSLFVVPARNTFWLTSASITALRNQLGGETDCFAAIRNSQDTADILSVTLKIDDSHANASNSFPMPIKFEEESIVQIVATTDCSAQGVIQGFLEPKRLN